MVWSKAQRQRLQAERRLLKRFFPAFNWINPTDSNNTRVEGNVCTNSMNLYKSVCSF